VPEFAQFPHEDGRQAQREFIQEAFIHRSIKHPSVSRNGRLLIAVAALCDATGAIVSIAPRFATAQLVVMSGLI
jgi:hypothetical protein